MARVINTGPGDTGAKVAGTAQKRQTRSTTAGTAQATAGPSTAKVPTTGNQAAQPTSSVAGPSTAKVAAPTAAKNGKVCCAFSEKETVFRHACTNCCNISPSVADLEQHAHHVAAPKGHVRI